MILKIILYSILLFIALVAVFTFVGFVFASAMFVILFGLQLLDSYRFGGPDLRLLVPAALTLIGVSVIGAILFTLDENYPDKKSS